VLIWIIKVFSGQSSWKLLKNRAYKKLCLNSPAVIEESAETRKVHKIAQYALDLSGAFNKFYKSVPVIGSEKEQFRLLLVDKSRITIRNSSGTSRDRCARIYVA